MIVYDRGFLEQPVKPLGLQAHAEEFGDILEGALFVRWAVSAIHIMNREQKAKSAFLKFSDGRGICFNDDRTRDSYGAGGNGFSLYFNKTQTAGGMRVYPAFEIA
jgi:hypothetical protein